jgi:HD domain
MDLVRQISILDKVLDDHAAELGGDFTAYRNHAYRVVNICVALSPDGPEHLEKIAIAAAFHDLGIWTDHTFDYIPPSIRLARAHLIASSQATWISEITEMILQHHKITPYRGDALVEEFRCADWTDVSSGLIRFGIPREHVKEVLSTWPDSGFHKRLLVLGLHRLRTNPWNPLPMIRV